MAGLEGLNPAFRAKIDALIKASGGKVTITSGYRDPANQAGMFEKAKKQYGGEQAARRYVAPPPGYKFQNGEVAKGSNHTHGTAVDLGGDLALAHRLAPQFGLFFPMSWEPWHIEPMGGGGKAAGGHAGHNHDDAYTTPPDGMPEATSAGPIGEFAALMDSPTLNDGITGLEEVVSGMRPKPEPVAASGGGGASFGSIPGGPEGLDAFMRAIGGQESGNNYGATNSSSGAHGKYQIMPANWPSWSKEAGLPAGAPQTPENQERVARFKMQQYYNQFGSWDKVAKAWYSGPGNVNKNVGGGKGYPDSNTYAKQVLSKMG